MPAQRDSEAVRGELADVQTRGRGLAEREAEAIGELQTAQARHGELYAEGADQPTIRRQASAIGALKTELEGLAVGRARLAQQAETLGADLEAAQAAEALETATTAYGEASAALGAVMAFWRSVLSEGGEFDMLDTTLREAGERARRASGMAAEMNPERRAEIERRAGNLWRPFGGLLGLMQMVDVFRQNSTGPAPVPDASAD